MSKVWTHKELAVWQRAVDLAEITYRVTHVFPREERFGLTSQMRRAAVSVLSNVAEGAARRTRRDFLHFLHIARGSLAELEAQTILAVRLQFPGDLPKVENNIQQVGKLLTGLIAKIGRDAKR